ncbi:UNVERIFIED_CONTAM: Xaa-Pro aminopeptidase [Williamsia faeni]
MTSSVLTSNKTTLRVPDKPDLARMRRETGARIRAEMTERGVDALILLGNNAVAYATGVSWPLGDAGLSHVERPVAVILPDDEWPYLFLPIRDGAPADSVLPDDHVLPPVYLEFDEGVETFARILEDLVPADATYAVDESTGAMLRAAKRLFPSGPPRDAALIIGAAKLIKTVDELSCIRNACRITEEAMAEVQAALSPGMRQIDLSAGFVRRAFERGATANMLDAIWQVMPSSKDTGVWTTHGDLALPLLTTERELAKGDVLWVDVSITYSGYCSDFGRTWIVGQDPTVRQQAQFRQWKDLITAVFETLRPGVTLEDLANAAIAANGGTKPWLPHFYLGHSIGTSAAEMPMIGTDLGPTYDKNFILKPGMVLVLEPVVWEDGTGGYRSEEIVVITEEGFAPLTDYPYTPYGD